MTLTPNLTPYALNLIQVKAYLGIQDTSKDSLIEKYLPLVSDDLFRVNGVLNQPFVIVIGGDITKDSAVVQPVNPFGLAVGNIVEAPGFGSGVDAPSIIEIGASSITLSAPASATEAGASLIIRTLPPGMGPTVAKMVQFRIDQENSGASAGLSSGIVKSRSIGPTSITYETGGSSGNLSLGKFGYPSDLIHSLTGAIRPRFF